jgi:hypothetical protein
MDSEETQSEGEGSCCPEHMCICLSADDLQRLGFKIPKVGTAVTMQATGYIESASIYEGKPQAMVKITKMDARLGADMSAKLAKAAADLYGSGGED